MRCYLPRNERALATQSAGHGRLRLRPRCIFVISLLRARGLCSNGRQAGRQVQLVVPMIAGKYIYRCQLLARLESTCSEMLACRPRPPLPAGRRNLARRGPANRVDVGLVVLKVCKKNFLVSLSARLAQGRALATPPLVLLSTTDRPLKSPCLLACLSMFKR